MKIVLNLTNDEADKLFAAVENNEFSSYGVVHVREISRDSPIGNDSRQSTRGQKLSPCTNRLRIFTRTILALAATLAIYCGYQFRYQRGMRTGTEKTQHELESATETIKTIQIALTEEKARGVELSIMNLKLNSKNKELESTIERIHSSIQAAPADTTISELIIKQAKECDRDLTTLLDTGIGGEKRKFVEDARKKVRQVLSINPRTFARDRDQIVKATKESHDDLAQLWNSEIDDKTRDLVESVIKKLRYILSHYEGAHQLRPLLPPVNPRQPKL